MTRVMLFGWTHTGALAHLTWQGQQSSFCGRRLVTVLDPADPAAPPAAQVCAFCRRRLPAPECPECGGPAVLVDRVVQPHGEWRMRPGGLVQSDRPCDGAGAVLSGLVAA